MAPKGSGGVLWLDLLGALYDSLITNAVRAYLACSWYFYWSFFSTTFFGPVDSPDPLEPIDLVWSLLFVSVGSGFYYYLFIYYIFRLWAWSPWMIWMNSFLPYSELMWLVDLVTILGD